MAYEKINHNCIKTELAASTPSPNSADLAVKKENAKTSSKVRKKMSELMDKKRRNRAKSNKRFRSISPR